MDFFNPLSVLQTGIDSVTSMISKISPLPGEYSAPVYQDTGAKEPVKEFITNPVEYIQKTIATAVTNTTSGMVAYTGTYAIGSILGFIVVGICGLLALKVLWDNRAFIIGLFK